MAQQPVALALAVGEETALDDVADFLDALRLEIASLRICDVLGNGFGYRRDLHLDRPDLPCRVPFRNQVRGSFPRREVERPAHLLAAQRALDVNRALTAAI